MPKSFSFRAARTAAVAVYGLALLAATPLAAQTTFFAGTVLGENTGLPLAAITVAAYRLDGNVAGMTNTDGFGRFVLPVNPGSYRLLAYDNNGVYAVSFYSNASSFETSATIHPPLEGIQFVLTPGHRVSGSVSVVNSLAPLGGMVVAAYNLDGTRRGHTRTGSSGSYSLVLPPGDYKFAAYDDNVNNFVVYGSQFFNLATSFAAAATVSVRGPLNNINFQLSQAGKVSGRVVTRATATPLAGIVIFAYNLNGAEAATTTSDSNGRFALILPGGNYKFVAADPDESFSTSFFRNASSFESASTFTVNPAQSLSNIDFALDESGQRVATSIFVPAAANGPGANNTFFQTDIWIQNPSDQTLSVMVFYLPGGQDNSSPTGVAVTIQPRQQMLIENVLEALFHTAGAGALKLESESTFRVISRTYNNPANSAQVGTFGLAIPGKPISDSLSRGVIGGLASNEAYRSNVGVLNPQTHGINVRYELFDATGNLLGEATRPFLPLEWFQANTIFSFLNLSGSYDNAYLVVSSQEGSFFAYGSVVDQKSGDGTIVIADD